MLKIAYKICFLRIKVIEKRQYLKNSEFTNNFLISIDPIELLCKFNIFINVRLLNMIEDNTKQFSIVFLCIQYEIM